MLAQEGQVEHVAAAGQHFEDEGDTGRGELVEGGGDLSVADGAVVAGNVLMLETALLAGLSALLVMTQEGLEGLVGHSAEVDLAILVRFVGAALAEGVAGGCIGGSGLGLGGLGLGRCRFRFVRFVEMSKDFGCGSLLLNDVFFNHKERRKGSHRTGSEPDPRAVLDPTNAVPAGRQAEIFDFIHVVLLWRAFRSSQSEACDQIEAHDAMN